MVMHSGRSQTNSARSASGRYRLRSAIGLLIAILPTAARGDDGADFFEKKVRPILAEHCQSCHSAGAKKTKGGLALDTSAGIRQGGKTGPAVTANDDASLLLRAVSHAPDAPAMPPEGKLPDDAIADLRRWIKMGAPLPAPTPAEAKRGDAARKFWSFLPVAERPAPRVSNPKWPITKADSFVMKELDGRKFSPAPAADRRTLIRRVTFDLVGLPPAIEDVEAYAADVRPDAYERLVDGLLASPRFGEKWGRHWLDVARYAEDNSTGESTCKPPRFPYRYRDWVIGAFNGDVPYDRFVRLQLAADLAADTAPADYAALGFLGLSPVYHKEPKLSKDVIAAIVADEWDERVDAVTRGFLGLTVACARCHDHKFDPITAEDYAALAGVMANTQLVERSLQPGADADAQMSVRGDLLDATLRLAYSKEMRGAAAKDKKDASAFDGPIKIQEERVAELQKRGKGFDAGILSNGVRDAGTWINGDDPAWTVIDYRPGKTRDLPVFIRGNPARPGGIVPRRFPAVLASAKAMPFRAGSGRAELADAIVTDAAGLTARVFVNRAWGWIFGRHLVGTPSNFGELGDRPTHPELLDDLAARFVANRWSMKWLVRELVLSATYRQSSRHDEKYAAAAPDNRWLWRAPRKRLELEVWRDAFLRVSGQLDLAGGGPSDNLDGIKSVRRTVYGKVSRERPADIHRLFDLPDPKGHGEKREATTTPVQQLYFLNSPFVRQAATALAKSATAGLSEEAGVEALFRRVLLRSPTGAELATARKLIRPSKNNAEPAWELLAQVLLTSNEFLFLN